MNISQAFALTVQTMALSRDKKSSRHMAGNVVGHACLIPEAWIKHRVLNILTEDYNGAGTHRAMGCALGDLATDYIRYQYDGPPDTSPFDNLHEIEIEQEVLG